MCIQMEETLELTGITLASGGAKTREVTGFRGDRYLAPSSFFLKMNNLLS